MSKFSVEREGMDIQIIIISIMRDVVNFQWNVLSFELLF
jgi:hypothetical protein